MWMLLLSLAGCRPADLQALLEREARRHDAPAATMTVVEAGELIFAGATGHWSLDSERPVDVRTRFRLGSLTKPFTAALILQLDEEGLLSVDDPISTWVDGVPSGEGIRLSHLLSHTSGLSDYTDIDGYWEDAQRPWSVEELLQLSYADGILFTPGASWQYSNAGYLLLGRAAEAATGQSWEQLIGARLIEPLGLKQTSVGGEDRARGYATDELSGVLQDCSNHPHSDNSWAAGAVVSSSEDVAWFADQLLSGAIVDERRVRWMTERVQLGGGPYRYGMGVGIDPWEGGFNIGHQGKSPGYASSWSHRPEVDLTIAVTMSTSDAGGRRIENAAWAWLLSR